MSRNQDLFTNAIKVGVSKAFDYAQERRDALNLISEANNAIEGVTGKKNVLLSIKGCFFETRGCFIQSLAFNGIDGCYPIVIKTNKQTYECLNIDELESELSALLSSIEFGFYIKDIVRVV